ncbi:hypothetical protein [Sphingomonas mucosissima]|uniref:Uncharacterized protein n=1 Tax=Sphingomonas mucosissima TaxID=370959 RepID=A0A245ZRE4_9SPHN|nr:hypothetical protein [Sphingomonas mucosissima]OWK32299.1 hypothetical protein SPMU_06210 [Sphingomonas mucosissima]
MGKLQRRLGDELILYVRQMAWLNAVPKPDVRSRRGKAAEIEPPRLSRLEDMRKRKIQLMMPPVQAPELIARLIEIGLTEGGGMAPAPLSWSTIAGWSQVTKIPLQPWEARLMRRLSVEYVAEGRRAENENCPPPWRSTQISEAERVAELDDLQKLLG